MYLCIEVGNDMAVLKCKMCGASLEVVDGSIIAKCDYCGTTQTLPRISDDDNLKLFDRANEHRLNNEFDKAISVYEIILSKNSTDCEAFWGIVLSKFGVEYVKDPATGKRVPTINRCQYTSVLDDSDYKNVLRNADEERKRIYEQEAEAIDTIQRHILEVSRNEDDFDIFISCKETDSKGVRTIDSVKAQELYETFTQAGYKVFFARITLESKLGEAYEPYIFSAINSAKVMLVVGSSNENFNAVWVRNEWSRYLAIANRDKSKRLVPIYINMSPYDMPNEFKYLEGQDAGKVGFIQDLVRGVQKIVGLPADKSTLNNTAQISEHSSVTKITEVTSADSKKLKKPNTAIAVASVICVLTLIIVVIAVVLFVPKEVEPQVSDAEVVTEDVYDASDDYVDPSDNPGVVPAVTYTGNGQTTKPYTTQPTTTPPQPVSYGPGYYTVEIGVNERVSLRSSYEYGSPLIKRNGENIRITSGETVYVIETAIIKDPETGKYALKGKVNYEGYEGWCFIKWVNSVDTVNKAPAEQTTVYQTTAENVVENSGQGVYYTVDTLDNSSVRFTESYEWGAKAVYDGKQAIYIKDGTELLVYETMEVAEKGGGVALKGKTTYKGKTGWCFLCWVEAPPTTTEKK